MGGKVYQLSNGCRPRSDIISKGGRAVAPGRTMRHQISLSIAKQPDEVTCGPTCLHAIYRYFGDRVSLDQVIDGVHPLDGGGTLGVLLACHALRRGYRATIYSYNLQVFDPTWFTLHRTEVRGRLERQRRYKTDPKLQIATRAYLEFLELGGNVRFADLSESLLRSYLASSRPILTGLSATYLYGQPRELGPEGDDVRGEPTGHFVVICGHDPDTHEVLIADPLDPNPVSHVSVYPVSFDRLAGAIFLGIVTYDANLLVVEPAVVPADREEV
jgi:hypothetical protein